MKNIAIYGAGGFGREVAQLIDDINEEKPRFNLIGFFDDGLETGATVNDWKVLGGVRELNAYKERLLVVIAVGAPDVKRRIVESINNAIVSFPVLIHPSVVIGDDKYHQIGEGSIITAACVITVNVEIGKHVILNLCCTVGHDAVIGDYASFMPSVNISGEVEVGEEVFVGTGAKIINLMKIGRGSIIGAGAVVSKSIPPSCTAVGIPAKPIKFHNE